MSAAYRRRNPLMSEIARHRIDGEWTGSGAVSESVNPATGEVLGRWADGGEAEAWAAVAAARRAFDTSPWSRDRSLRHRAPDEMAARFDARAEELGMLVTKEKARSWPRACSRARHRALNWANQTLRDCLRRNCDAWRAEGPGPESLSFTAGQRPVGFRKSIGPFRAIQAAKYSSERPVPGWVLAEFGHDLGREGDSAVTCVGLGVCNTNLAAPEVEAVSGEAREFPQP
jgi:hypothetical protein